MPAEYPVVSNADVQPRSMRERKTWPGWAAGTVAEMGAKLPPGMNPLLHSARYDVLLKPTGIYADRMRQRERRHRREARLAAAASAAAGVMSSAVDTAHDAGAAGSAMGSRRDSLDMPSPLPLSRHAQHGRRHSVEP